jgi:hypothetical protein
MCSPLNPAFTLFLPNGMLQGRGLDALQQPG